VLVVDVDESMQIKRVMRRDQINEQAAKSILKAQPNRQERLKMADDVIDNSCGLADLTPQVERLHRKYCKLAAIYKKAKAPRDQD
jgi:dephospho-CoA kinase